MTATSWSSGYRIERAYDYAYAPQMLPPSIALAAVNAGVRPPPRDRFRYFEMGCGFGMMTALMAGANPRAELWANDFIPAHVLDARALVEEAELTNVQFLEAGFDELLKRDLPEFDFIGLHGVYSWVSAENRQRIIEFIRRHLKTGGFVYVSYNSQVGFASMAPVRALLMSAVESLGGTIEQSMRSSIELLQKVGQARARYFEITPEVNTALSRLQRTAPAFILHELFNRDWTLFLHSEVAAELANAKLGYVASARLLDDLPLLLTPAHLELLRHIPQPALREDVRDFVLNTSLRRDVFARGTTALSPEERSEHLSSTHFALCMPRVECLLTANVAGGEVQLLEHVHTPMLDALASAPRSLSELSALPALAPLGRDAVHQGVLALVALGYVAPALDQDGADERAKSAARLNAAITARANGSRPLPCLCSPLLGSGVLVNPLDQLFVRAHEEGRDLVDYALSAVRRGGQKIFRDGQPLQNADERVAEVKSAAHTFVQAELSFLAQLGVLSS
jgi:SAM-dependent methyltransferase